MACGVVDLLSYFYRIRQDRDKLYLRQTHPILVVLDWRVQLKLHVAYNLSLAS